MVGLEKRLTIYFACHMKKNNVIKICHDVDEMKKNAYLCGCGPQKPRSWGRGREADITIESVYQR